MTSTRTIGPRTRPRPFNPYAKDVAETPNGRRSLASRWAHEDRAAQEREGPEGRQEPFRAFAFLRRTIFMGPPRGQRAAAIWSFRHVLRIRVKWPRTGSRPDGPR